ncbi:MAG: hypothetical protein WCP46_00975 [Alphaproteobacteria bacterium]
MNIVKEYITPQMARELLKGNNSNRSLNENRILFYAKAMKNGEWKEDTAEMIKLSISNNLIDGQHRLHALIKANASIYMHVAYNISESVFDVLDTGKARSAGDILSSKGIPNPTKISSSISGYYNLKKGNRFMHQQKSTTLSNQEVLKYYNEKPEFWQKVANKARVWEGKFSRVLPLSFIASHYVLFSEISIESAEVFFTQLCTGENISNATMHTIRKCFLDDKLNISKIPTNNKSIYILKAWNAFRMKKEIKRIIFDLSKEDFPRPI